MISLLRSRFDRSGKRAVILTAEAVLVFQWQTGSVTGSFVFDADEHGQGNFDRYLRESESLTTYMLVDLVDEEYRQETIPPVSGADRQALVARKQAWLFRGTPYCHVLSQGREAGGRRDERVLFSAILNHAAVALWVGLFAKNKVPLAGIYSLPLLSETLLTAIGANSTNTLLVTMQSSSGLRQTYFHEGALKQSRLAKMPRLGSVPYASYVFAEVGKFQRYLTTLRVNSKSPLEVVVLTHGDLLDALAAEYSDNDNVRYLLVDVAEAARSLGVQGVLTTPFSDYLFAHLLLQRTPKNHYATHAERRYALLYNTKRALLATTALTLSASLLLGAWNIVEGVSLKQDADDDLSKAVFYESRYQDARQDLPPTPVEPSEIKVAVEIVDALKQHRAEPMRMIGAVSRVLSDYPALKVEAVDWSSGAGSGTNSASALAVGLEQAQINGRIDSFDGNFRLAIATVNAFVEALRHVQGVREVTVVKQPLDVSSKSNLLGGSAEERNAEVAAFSVRIVMESYHEMG